MLLKELDGYATRLVELGAELVDGSVGTVLDDDVGLLGGACCLSVVSP
jgi:hypothetical protein